MHCEPRQEGYEFDLFDELLGGDYNLLPEQISFELHLITQFPSQPWFHRQKTIGEQPGTGPPHTSLWQPYPQSESPLSTLVARAGELAVLGLRIWSAGYRAISREDNTRCGHCSEFTIARFKCPNRPHSSSFASSLSWALSRWRR